MASPAGGTDPAGPRWLADGMLGRLARYLRFMGHDVRFERNTPDAGLMEIARTEGRILLTRDRALAARCPGCFEIPSVDLREQLRAVRGAFPAAGYEVRFTRCTVCNGPLHEVDRGARETYRALVPAGVIDRDLPLYRCAECGHLYWEGSHTARVRAYLAETWGSP